MLDEQKKTGEEVFHRRFAQISADFLKKEKRGLVFFYPPHESSELSSPSAQYRPAPTTAKSLKI
jgi:23S rRNA A2030 N6-methylase RlmJ